MTTIDRMYNQHRNKPLGATMFFAATISLTLIAAFLYSAIGII